MTDENVAALADATIAVLRDDGWTQGAFVDRDTGERCLVGAARIAYALLSEETRQHGAYDQLMRRLNSIIAEQYPDRRVAVPPGMVGDRVIEFNDHTDTTRDDVVAVLEKARNL